MEQILVGLTDKLLNELNGAAKILNKSRAELLREAAEFYLAHLAEEAAAPSSIQLLTAIKELSVQLDNLGKKLTLK